jgi:hypothetical protein
MDEDGIVEEIEHFSVLVMRPLVFTLVCTGYYLLWSPFVGKPQLNCESLSFICKSGV